MMPDLIGLDHFRTAENCVQHMQKNNALTDIISILGVDGLSEGDKNLFLGRGRWRNTSLNLSPSPKF
eukprot:UN03383